MKQALLALMSAFALAGLTTPALAAPDKAAKTQFDADSKIALSRYNSDKLLCDDEKSSSARLQCRRDAKAEYDKAIASAKAKMNKATPVASAAKAAPAKTADAKALCDDCAKVLAVNVIEKEGEGGALGIIAGGAAGALLGNQVGGGTGKDIATVVGAVGGAYAGKTIEGQMKSRKVWSVTVQNPFGIKKNFRFDQNPGFAVGDTVKYAGDTIVRR